MEEALKPGSGQSTAVSTAIWEAMNTIMLLKLQLMNSMKHTRYLELELPLKNTAMVLKKDETVKTNEASFKDFEYYRYNSRELLERLTLEEIFTYLLLDFSLIYKDMNERRKLYVDNKQAEGLDRKNEQV